MPKVPEFYKEQIKLLKAHPKVHSVSYREKPLKNLGTGGEFPQCPTLKVSFYTPKVVLYRWNMHEYSVYKVKPELVTLLFFLHTLEGNQIFTVRPVPNWFAHQHCMPLFKEIRPNLYPPGARVGPHGGTGPWNRDIARLRGGYLVGVISFCSQDYLDAALRLRDAPGGSKDIYGFLQALLHISERGNHPDGWIPENAVSLGGKLGIYCDDTTLPEKAAQEIFHRERRK